jgi:phage protein D
MNKDVKVKTYEAVRRSEIVHAIAKDYGFGDEQRFVEDTETVYEHIVQARQTDAQFIKRLADAEHFEFYVDFSGLHWHPRKMGQKPLRTLQYYLPPDVGDIIDWNVESDPFAKPTKVTVKARDPDKKGATTTAVGSDAVTKRIALVAPDTGVVGGLTPVTDQAVTKPTTETDPKQVKKEADGAFKRSVQVAVKLSLNMVGDPLVIAKSVISIRGISTRLSGLYYINAASHKIDSSGYKLGLKVTTDASHGHSQNILATPASPKKPTKAELNPAKPGDAPKDPNALVPSHVVDPSTGTVATKYSGK